MHSGMDATSFAQAPRLNAEWENCLYFCTFIVRPPVLPRVSRPPARRRAIILVIVIVPGA